MRTWSFAFFALLVCSLHAQRPHLAVPPDSSADRVQVFGTVKDSLTGKPVYDCLVAYYDLQGERRSVSSVNSDGYYAMFIPAHLPFELRIEREDGYKDLGRRAPVIPNGVKQFRLDLVMLPK